MSEAQETKFEKVTFAQAEAACKAAAEAADEREELAVNFGDLLDTPLSQLSQESFEPLVGQAFEIEMGIKDLMVDLKEVNSLGDAVKIEGESAPVRAPFSVVFQGRSTRALLPAGFYRMRNPALGEFEIYLSVTEPEGHDENKPLLEAVFN